MYCINCGTQIPDEANFCSKCGKLQTSKIEKVEETKWETCEIAYTVINQGHLLSNRRMMFWANAIGVNGNYNAGESVPFEQYTTPPSSSDQRALAAHREFISQLTKNGWESAGDRGEDWWCNRFRRKATASSPVQENAFVNLIILDAGHNKIETIKVIRMLTDLGLGEAKILAETPNGVILRQVARSIASEAQSRFQKVGATVKMV